MKSIFFSAVLFVSIIFSGTAQTDQPTLNVKGQSSVSIKPTMTIMTFNIQADGNSYAGVVEELVSRVDQLTNVLIKDLKFEASNVVTSSFQVSKNYVYDRGVRKDTGFVATQQLMVEFKQDKKKLLNVLTKTTASKSNPEISISFDLDNVRKAKLKTELIKMAVEDAKSKAEVISSTAGYKITGIQKIEYGNNGGNQPIPYQVSSMRLKESADVEFSNFEASNLSYSDQVDIIYTISPIQ